MSFDDSDSDIGDRRRPGLESVRLPRVIPSRGRDYAQARTVAMF